MLSDAQFDRTRRLALQLAGIELVERHRELLRRRSRRLGIPDRAGLDALLDAAEAGDAAATQKLVCLLTTKFTAFFRHPRHFELAAQHALQVARRNGQARLWSAGTATGEEAWSLAIAVIEASGDPAPPCSILATDIDTEALAIAQRGDYADAALTTLSPMQRERCFARAGAPQRQGLVPAVRRLVEFQPLNLVGPRWGLRGKFDVIFCRNVLMYLEARERVRVLERLAAQLAPDGRLWLDPTEHLGAAARWFTTRGDGGYAVAGEALSRFTAEVEV